MSRVIGAVVVAFSLFSSAFAQIRGDTDGDGQLSRDEFHAASVARFSESDARRAIFQRMSN